MYKRSLHGFCVIIILIVTIPNEISSSLPNERYSGCSGTRCNTCSSCLTQEDPNYGWCGSKPDDGYCMFGTAASPTKDTCFLGWSFYLCPPYEYFQVSIFNQSSHPDNPPLACFKEQNCIIDSYVPPNANLANSTHSVFPYTNPIPFGYGIVTAVIVMETAVCITDDDNSQIAITYTITGAPGEVDYMVTVPESGICGPNNIAYLYSKDLPYIVPNVIWWSNYSYNNNLHVLNISNIDTRLTAIGIVALSLRFLAVQVDPHIESTTLLVFFSGETPDLIQFVGTNYVKLVYYCDFYPKNRTGSNPNTPVTKSMGVIMTDTLYGCEIPISNEDAVSIPKLGEPTSVYYKFGPDGIVIMNENPLRTVDLYVMPILQSLVPDEGSTDSNTKVLLVGEGFFNTINTKLTVFLGDVAVKGVYLNSTCISFVAPPIFENISKICVFVSMDSITKTSTCLTFTYFKPPPAPNPFSPIPKGPTILTDWVFYAACSAIVLVVVIVVAIYCKTRVERKKGRNSRLQDVAIEDRTAVERAEIPPEEIQFAEVVGSGSFSIVYKGIWQGQKIAIKVIKASEPREDLLVEAAIMIKLQHPNIVKFMGACLQNPAASLFIVTEYLPRGSLSKILSNRSYKIEYEHSRKWAHDTCLGMSYLHNSNIIHRDLKPANLLVAEDWSVKVADFGLSRVLGNAQVTQTLTACGTISCSAPEVLRDQRYSLKADVYSFGVCLWAMFTRKKPYPKKTDAQIVIAVAIEGKRLPIPPRMPKEVTKLLKTCWQTDPKSRPTFQVLADTLMSISLPHPHHPYPSLSEMDIPETITSVTSMSPSSMSPSSDPGENVVTTTIIDETAKLLD